MAAASENKKYGKAESKKSQEGATQASDTNSVTAMAANEKKSEKKVDVVTKVPEEGNGNKEAEYEASDTLKLAEECNDDDNLKSLDEITSALGGVTFRDFVEKFFKLDRKGVFNAKTTIEKVSSWKGDLIKTSLLQLPPDMASEALQIFRNVTGYMGDRGKTNKEPVQHAIKILATLMRTSEKYERLRDEVYCQICKQVNENPKLISSCRGWQLMVIMISR